MRSAGDSSKYTLGGTVGIVVGSAVLALAYSMLSSSYRRNTAETIVSV
jgi:hypothetical protein